MMRRLVAALAVAVLCAVAGVPAAAAAAPDSCRVTSGHLDWGVKKEFRDYISGPVAGGSWMEGGGASFQDDSFRWSSASGTVAQGVGTGLVGFIGSVTFNGHAKTITRTLANPELQFVRPSLAYLLLDVSGVKTDGTSVNSRSVQFAALTLPTDALVTGTRTLVVSDAPATLTDEGSKVFGGYAPGDALDPVSFTLQFSSACTAGASARASAKPDDAISPVPVGLLPWMVLGLGVAAIAVLLGLVVLRRRTR